MLPNSGLITKVGVERSDLLFFDYFPFWGEAGAWSWRVCLLPLGALDASFDCGRP